MSISVSGFADDVFLTLTVAGPYTGVTGMTTVNGGFTMNYPTGLHFPAGSYTVTAVQGTSSATTSFTII